MHLILRFLLGTAIVLGSTMTAFAIYPKLSTPLVGPAIFGTIPVGQVRVDQSKLPKVPGVLAVEVRNINLPDGTVLAVELDGEIVGAIMLSRHQGSLTTTILTQVGRGSSRVNVYFAGSLILTNPGAWKT